MSGVLLHWLGGATPFPTLLCNPNRRVFQISMADSDEVILQRCAASICPVTTREGRAALEYITRDLLTAVRLARQEEGTEYYYN
jgi:hypothetical protein